MNWTYWRLLPAIDTRAEFVARAPSRSTLLDLGTSDGKTLTHFRELRPDLRLCAVDLKIPESIPPGTEFAAVNLERDKLPWPDKNFDSITCMHLIEHLRVADMMWAECARVLTPGGRIYVETPGPLSLVAKSVTGRARGSVTMNFFDDPTHTALVPVARMMKDAEDAGLTVVKHGKSRNWLFVLAYPLLRVVRPNTRKRYVAKLHWMGWSHYLIAEKSHA